ncbi:MAG: hypothetical protein KC421_08450 [Anaerolineales bacterium]|nr:hypothetical protein [Anaerolineales bacterium]
MSKKTQTLYKTKQQAKRPSHAKNKTAQTNQTSQVQPGALDKLPDHVTIRPLRQNHLLLSQQIHGNAHVQQNLLQRQNENEAKITAPSVKMAGPFGDFDINTFSGFYAATRFYPSLLRNLLKEVDEFASVRERCQIWFEESQDLQTYLKTRGDDQLDIKWAEHARGWYADYQTLSEDISAYKQKRVRDAIENARAALDKAYSHLESQRPMLDEAMRNAFLSEDGDVVQSVANVVGNMTDIGLDIQDLSRQMADALADANGTTLPPISKYTNWLKTANKVLASINLIYAAAKIEAPTEYGTALNGINGVTNAFSSGGTLLGLAPHIGLYANLYLVPLTEIITKQLNQILGKHLHDLNMVASEIDFVVDCSSEPGGCAVYNFMVPLMHAENSDAMPWPMPEKVQDFFLQWQDNIQTLAGSEIPTTGWWFWKEIDQKKGQDWVYYQRENLWAMFYGSMAVPKQSAS